MTTVLVFAVLAVAMVSAGFGLRSLVRRMRRLRRLQQAEADVVEAVADGRLAKATGEAVLQHLEGLRRVAREGED